MKKFFPALVGGLAVASIAGIAYAINRNGGPAESFDKLKKSRFVTGAQSTLDKLRDRFGNDNDFRGEHDDRRTATG